VASAMPATQTSGSRGQERLHGVKDMGSVGRDVPDQSKERNTEIAVEAGHKNGEHREIAMEGQPVHHLLVGSAGNLQRARKGRSEALAQPPFPPVAPAASATEWRGGYSITSPGWSGSKAQRGCVTPSTPSARNSAPATLI
jgi:hypothetical protein